MSSGDYPKIVYDFLRNHPGATGLQVGDELRRFSRAAAWFGPESFWTLLFGPGVGTTYTTLAELEKNGLITSWWGEATAERGWRRPRHYRVKEVR